MTDTVITIFQNYGWPGVIAVVFIIILTHFINSGQKKSDKKMSEGFEKLSDSMIQQNNKLIDAITTSITKNNQMTQDQLFNIINRSIKYEDNRKREQHDDKFNYRINISNNITSILKEINDTCHAARTIIVEFHNSNENLVGLPFAKYDATFEWLNRDVSTISSKLKDMQIQIISPIIPLLKDAHNNIIHFDENDINNVIYHKSSVLYSQLKEININDIIYSGIYDNNNKLIGLICIEFTNKHPYIDNNVDYESINTLTEKISLLIQMK